MHTVNEKFEMEVLIAYSGNLRRSGESGDHYRPK